MRKVPIAIIALVAFFGSAPSLAKGCIRGAIAGGVAGHYVGRGHAFLGAAGGCVAMHHYYAKQAAQKRAAARMQAQSRAAVTR